MSVVSIIASEQHVADCGSVDPVSLDYTPHRDDVVISLTSVPSRLPVLKAVVNGLLQQSVRGVPIELHLPRQVRSTSEEWRDLPSWLTGLRAVRLILHQHDVGPAMKFLPALRAAGDRLVVVVDDDVIYPNDLTALLIDADREAHGAAAICYRGWRIHPLLSFEQSVLSAASPEGCPVGIVTGHGGYCLRASHVDLTSLSSFDGVPDECRMMDDIWISGHLSRQCTPKLSVPGSSRYKIPISSALGGDRDRRNDVALRWFSGDWRAEDIEQVK